MYIPIFPIFLGVLYISSSLLVAAVRRPRHGQLGDIAQTLNTDKRGSLESTGHVLYLHQHSSASGNDFLEPTATKSGTLMPFMKTHGRLTTKILKGAKTVSVTEKEDTNNRNSNVSFENVSRDGTVQEIFRKRTFVEFAKPSESRQRALFTSSSPQHFSAFKNSFFQGISGKAANISSTLEEEISPFGNFLNLTTENFTQCFKEGNSLHFNALHGHISFSGAANTTNLKGQMCEIELNLPSGMAFVMWVYLKVNVCGVLTLGISDSDGYSKEYVCSILGAYVRSPNNSVRVELVYTQRPQTRVDLFLNFTTIPQPRVEVTFTTPTTGFIQSPGWDGEAKYPTMCDMWARLDIPANHSVMISFQHLDIEPSPDCQYDQLAIIARDETHSDGDNSSSSSTARDDLVLCNSEPFPEPGVFRSNRLSFHFVSDGVKQYSGFKLLFSFHHASAVPEKMSSGLWNCSVAYWPQFRQHIGVCNVVEACHGGEDEANCSHLTQECGRGSLSIDGRCYVLVVQDRKVTWNEAASECFRRFAYLASLNSPAEWDGVIEFISRISDSKIYFGLQASAPNFPELYRKMFQWSDESAAFYFHVFYPSLEDRSTCSLLTRDIAESRLASLEEKNYLALVDCGQALTDTFLCEKESTERPHVSDRASKQILIRRNISSGLYSHVTCPAGHTVFKFLACDIKSKCWTNQMDSPSSSCEAPMMPLPPSFECNSGLERVPYTLVCDHLTDCSDNSDENFCVLPSCRRAGKFKCSNKQCLSLNRRCDKRVQCLDGSDEQQCIYEKLFNDNITPKPPAIIDFDGGGFFSVKPFNATQFLTVASETLKCPETHFPCPGNNTVFYCMPIFVRCNAVADCPGREDEAECDSYACPGFHRCRASPVCYHAGHACDGVLQCPQGDDEFLCGFACPDTCTCYGSAFFCFESFPAKEFGQLRFLDARGSGISPEDVRNNSMLILLNVAECDLTHLAHVELPNLRILDLSQNLLKSINAEEFQGLTNLRTLSLAGNPLRSFFLSLRNVDFRFSYLRVLDASEVPLSTLNITTFSILFPNLRSLNLSGSGAARLFGEGFHSLKYLKYLDLRKCPVQEFPAGVFGGLRALTEIWADNYKLCCPAILPRSVHPRNCHSPSDEISSCDALLRFDFYRVFLSVFSSLALMGNLGSFVYRVFVKRVGSNLGFGAFVTHLCVSDFLMGVYLAAIGVADRIYLGSYLWNDTVWKKSTVCKAAGFLSLLSSEVSAFTVCLITLDRFLVLRFPFSRLHFGRKSAHVACGVAWLIGFVLAAIPLLPFASHWEFYSHSGICVPLPITRNDFAGHDYSFSVTIIVNFVLFLLITTGQVFVYWSIRSNSIAGRDTTSAKKSRDVAIARRLAIIVMSDFLCWFPIGLLGLLASNGVPVPGEVNVTAAVIILPVNSAINPFLYTLNLLLAARRQAREKQLQKVIMSAKASKYANKAVGTDLESIM